jgi:Helix-turn-helix domain
MKIGDAVIKSGEFISAAVAARDYLRCSPNYVTRLCREGKFKQVRRIGQRGHWKILKAEVLMMTFPVDGD